jgi:hypothetical protein
VALVVSSLNAEQLLDLKVVSWLARRNKQRAGFPRRAMWAASFRRAPAAESVVSGCPN